MHRLELMTNHIELSGMFMGWRSLHIWEFKLFWEWLHNFSFLSCVANFLHTPESFCVGMKQKETIHNFWALEHMRESHSAPNRSSCHSAVWFGAVEESLIPGRWQKKGGGFRSKFLAEFLDSWCPERVILKLIVIRRHIACTWQWQWHQWGRSTY